MKRLLLAALLGLPLAASAQTSAVPASISYQGKVTDAAGALIGAGTPVNRDVIFRIYDGPTSSTILYAERQNVTISNGEFSVLIGVGGPVGSEPKPALDQAFLASQRYLGITVDDGNAGTDLEISPRQQIATTPFSFRAKIAEALTDNAVSSTTMIANNAVTSANIAASAITTAKLASSAVANGNIAASAVDSAKIADLSIATADLANGSVTAAKLASDIGVWTVNGSNVYRNSNVGIGSTANPGDRLTVSGGNIRIDSERFIAFSGPDNFNHNNKSMPFYGIGSYVDSDLGVYPSTWLSGFQGLKFFTTGASRMIIAGDGRVSIGTVTPDDQLNVYSGATEAAIRVQSGGTGEGSQDGIRIGTNGGNAFFHSYEPIPMTFSTGPAVPLTLHPENRVGLGGANTDGNSTVMIKSTGHGYPLIIESGGAAFFFNNSGQAYKLGGGSWGVSSDVRLKTDIKDVSGSLEKLLRLHSVTFRYKDQAAYGAGEQTGFIAQEVEKIFPTWVSDGPGGFKAVTVYGFESLTVQALRELRAEKDAQIAALQKRAETAEARLAALEKQVAALVAAQR